MHLHKPRRCPARCLMNSLLPDSYTAGQFQCSAPFPRLLLQPRVPDGALDILVSVTSGTSGLLSGRPLLRKWIKWIGQPKTVSPEFYESSLSKIYPSGHWLGCDSRSSWVKGCLIPRNTTVGVPWVHKSRTEPSTARSLL